MKARHQRLSLIVAGLAVLGLVAYLVLTAFQSNLVFFFTPTQVANGEAPKGKSFRIGGLVKEGSLQRQADGVSMRFVITDTDREIAVTYKGILPDLFREGKGVVAQGKLDESGLFTASEVLAKHDENYMPPEAAKAVGDAHERAAAEKARVEATAKTLKP
ncbi:MAG TPA: cytochrome c maturation protein CcmE [Accumulibacter sp.]|nr:cytochrome c maturation protein CcmE [Accumulibacter sp.]HPP46419.1 cytochrome c maturation protein CcmE [Accumulibacter sp.]